MKKKNILIVCAHPDDEIIGCGGTALRFIKEGNKVYVLILGEGVTSRDEEMTETKRNKKITELKKETREANGIIGTEEVFIHSFPDNRFDSIPMLKLIKVIERIKDKIKPEVIFTHYQKDLNIDHRVVFWAVLAATRPFAGETVKEIYSFEVLSSTEFSYPLSFSPDIFFDITDVLDTKLRALEKYTSEIRKFPHLRSCEALKLNARNWGLKVGLGYVEAFKCVRCIHG